MNEKTKLQMSQHKAILGAMKLMAVVFMTIGFIAGVFWEKDRESKRQEKLSIESSSVNTNATESK